MPYSTAGKNAMLDALGITHVSAHTADPGDTGANEVTGGSYARQAITFGAAAAGAIDSSNQPTIPIPGGTTVTHIGFWDALTGGNFLASGDVTDEVFGSDGNYVLSDCDLDLNS